MSRVRGGVRVLASALAAAMIVACASGPSGGTASGADPFLVRATDRFELRSDPRVALHHFLLDWSLADAGEWPPYAPPIREREGWQDSLSAEDARVWGAAVAAYGAARGRSLVFDRGLVAVRDWAAGTGPRDAIPATDRLLADAIDAALPVFLRTWWPEHDRRSRAFIEALAPTLDGIEEAVVPRLEAAYGGRWPSEPIAVDVMVHANDVGAYSVGGRVTLSGWNRRIRMPHAVDLVFHEASHVEGLEGALVAAVDAAFEAVGREPPERLWHDLIFFTTGEVVRGVFEARGEPGFRPYAEATGVYDRGARWAGQLPVLREHWQPFLESGSADPGARRAALEALARALPRS